ncbi:hypothetical protein Tco_1491982, partial [Tanacetum coccineum]
CWRRRFRGPQVEVLTSREGGGSRRVTVTQKDHDISLLNSRATCLASTLDDAKVACAEAGNKITSLAYERDRLASEVSSLRAGF